MKNIFAIIAAALLVFACGGGSSHTQTTGSGVTIDYEDMEVYPVAARGCFADHPERAYDGNEQSYANVYHPTFKSRLKVEFPCDGYGVIKEQEFWALLHGNGHEITVREEDGTALGTVNPPEKGWFCFRTQNSDWTGGVKFFCPGGGQLMVFEVYKIVTYEHGE